MSTPGTGCTLTPGKIQPRLAAVQKWSNLILQMKCMVLASSDKSTMKELSPAADKDSITLPAA